VYFEDECDITNYDVLMDAAKKARLYEIDASVWLGSEDVGRQVDEEARQARENEGLRACRISGSMEDLTLRERRRVWHL